MNCFRRVVAVSKLSRALLFACLFLLPIIAESQSGFLTPEGIASGQAYSDTIINYLKVDLGRLESSAQSYESREYHTLQYLIKKLADDDFAGLFSSEIRRWGPEGGCVELAWQSVPYYDDPPDWLPIHPFLPANNGDAATLCSFRETTELSFLRLPIRIRNYAEMLIKQRYSNENPYGVGELHRIEGDSLKLLFPGFANSEYYLVNGSTCETSKVSALVFVVEDFGPYQIWAEFEKPLWKVILAFPVREDQNRPRLVPFAAVPAGLPLDTSAEISVIPTHENGPVFIGKKCPVGISFEMLWDANSNHVLQLWACFDMCWGNHHPCFSSNYLLEYNNEFFVFRVDDELAELIPFTQVTYQRQTLADETAPEL